MKDFVPLLQTFCWVGLILFGLHRFTTQLSDIFNALTARIVDGSSFEAGPIKIGEKLKEISQAVEDLEKEQAVDVYYQKRTNKEVTDRQQVDISLLKSNSFIRYLLRQTSYDMEEIRDILSSASSISELSDKLLPNIDGNAQHIITRMVEDQSKSFLKDVNDARSKLEQGQITWS